MRTFFHISLLVFLSTNAFPQIIWSKLIGGSGTDEGRVIEETGDGGYILLGYSTSNNGDVSGNHGDIDYWIAKLDSARNIQWQKSFGGSGSDVGLTLHQTNDGGYIAGGYSTSTNGDVVGNHGSDDFWLIKLDVSGNIQWKKSLGGTGMDQCRNLQQTSDGGYIVAGSSQSNDGDVSGNHGGFDCWIVKLDSSGSLQWQKSLGGTEGDYSNWIRQTTDHGYILTGSTNSNDGDVSGNHGKQDAWVSKLDSTGNLQWQKCFGSDEADGGLSIQQTGDGGYIMSGFYQIDDLLAPYGNFYIVKMDASGTMQWNKIMSSQVNLDGYEEYGNSIIEAADGGYLIAGRTDKNIPVSTASVKHCKVVKLFNNGDIEWNLLFGGTGYDGGHYVTQSSDGRYVIIGSSNSNDGDVSGNHGGRDLWIFKISGSICNINASITPSGSITICDGDTISLQANPGTGYAYKWLKDNIQVGTASALNVTQAGSYVVQVSGGTSSHGSCGEKPAPVAVVVDPAPACAITGNDIICSLETTEFTASIGGTSYSWSGPSGFTANTLNTGSISAVGTYSVTITGSNGCSGSCSRTLSNTLPVSCNITGNNTICPNDVTSFSVSGGPAFSWSGPGGFTANTSIIDSIQTAGTYSVTVTDANGCRSICSRALTVTSLPSCNITGTGSICSYGTTSFTASGGTSYSWSGPNGFTANTANTSTINTNGAYSVIITYANGCTGVCSKTLSYKNVQCNITGDTIICDNESTVFYTTHGFTEDNNWYDSGGTHLANGDAISNITTAGTFILVKTSNGCSDTCSVNLTVHPAPSCNIFGDSTICDYESTSFSVSDGSAFSWTGPNGFTSNMASINSIAAAGTYEVIVTDSNLCANTCSAILSVNSSPVFTITGDNAICADEATDFVVSAGASYFWSGPNGFSATTNGTGSINESGTYSVTGTDANGCSSSDNELLTVNPIPSISISGDTIICANESSEFTASGGTSYSWSGPGGFLATTASTGTINEEGAYSVIVGDNNGCNEAGSYPLNVIALTPPEICIVGVDSATGKNIIVWEKPVTTAIDSYIIYKETSQANVYARIGSQAYGDFSTFIDNQSIPEQNANKYKLEILDTCELATAGIIYHNTIHLSINQGVGTTWNLIWNHYEGFTFSTYNIYRGTSSANLTLLNSISSSSNSYTDLNPPSGTTIYYQIEVINPASCNPTAKMGNYSASRSNIVNTPLVGIDKPGEFSLRMYPNPFTSVITIAVPDNVVGPFELKLYNVTGCEIFTIPTIHDRTFVLSRSTLPEGIFFIELRNNTNTFMGKIIAY